MSAGYRVVALDIDGTLLRSDGTLSDRNADTVRAVAERGADIVYMTARALAAVRDIAVRVGVPAHAVCSVGAAVFELPAEKLLWEKPLAPSTACELMERITNVVPGAAFGWVTGTGIEIQPGYPDRLRDATTTHDTGPAGPVYTLFAREPGAADLSGAVGSVLNAAAELGHTAPGFVELVACGVDKLSALRTLCSRQGVSSTEVIAFGDGRADLDMVRWAGCGVAMANATAEVQAVANVVTKSCDDDGVAVTLVDVFL